MSGTGRHRAVPLRHERREVPAGAGSCMRTHLLPEACPGPLGRWPRARTQRRPCARERVSHSSGKKRVSHWRTQSVDGVSRPPLKHPLPPSRTALDAGHTTEYPTSICGTPPTPQHWASGVTARDPASLYDTPPPFPTALDNGHTTQDPCSPPPPPLSRAQGTGLGGECAAPTVPPRVLGAHNLSYPAPALEEEE